MGGTKRSDIPSARNEDTMSSSMKTAAQVGTSIFLKHCRDGSSPEGYLQPDTFKYAVNMCDDEGCAFTFNHACAFWFLCGEQRWLAIMPEHHSMIFIEMSDITFSAMWEIISPDNYVEVEIPQWT
jgi:hypothetical protein